ncbi:MAG TPA: condensation domain-containing protein, partial [Polyangiaceae bacterium]|nr:condensation domain-containing protein [Polyangiaceae bacterium]
LLTALVQSVGHGIQGVLVDVEGHGRESLGNDALDLSRTLGWFTTQFPVWLETEENALRALDATRAKLRSVPAKGLHYGLLRFGAEASVRAAMSALPRPQISFNYLGRFDGTLAKGGAFSLASEDSGAPVAATSPLSHALDVNALIIAGELSLRLRIDPALMSSSALSELSHRFEACLRALVEQGIEHAPKRGAEAFPLALLGDAEADALDSGTDVEDVYPATPLQQGLLFHTLLGRSEGAYINQLAVTIRGPLNPEAFFAAWREVLERHPILRTSFEWKHGGAALQVVHRCVELPGSLIDASDATNYSEKWAVLRAADRDCGFELQRAPLMRITLVRRPDGAHDLLWTTHHALLDGWSTSRVLGEVLEAYRFGRVQTVVPPPYRDYVAWLQRCPSSEAWWRAKLASLGEAAGFCDAVGATDTGTESGGGSFEQRLSPALSEQLRKRAQRWQVTLPALVQAAWAIVLSRYANRSHVVFGMTVSGRNVDLPGAEQMLGLFINSLPVWVEVRSDVLPADLARSIVRYMSELGPHEQTPLHELQGWAGHSGTALFDSLLVFENYPVHEALSDHPLDLRFEAAEMLDETHYPLTLTIKPGSSLAVDWAWRGAQLDASDVERVAQHLSAVLEQLAQGEERCIGDIRLAVAVRQVPSLESYRFVPIVERIAAQVARDADACAVQCGEARLSYAELDRWSAAIARRLRRAGVTSERRVGVCVERSLALPAALLGVLRAGGAYLPLDPSYPSSRLAYMLDDAAVRCVVADAESAALLAERAEGRQIIVLDSSLDDDDEPGEGSTFRVQPAGLAYVLYTSGSTGRPKGVAVSHEALDRFLLSAGERLSFRADDVWLSVTSPSFDIFALELYLPLLTGARVELAPRDHVTDGAALAQLITASGATFLQATPVTWRALVDSGWRSSASLTALSGGEALAPDLAAALIERGVTLWNMYGPTETTIWSSAARLEAGNPITLGTPFPDCPIRVVDTHGEVSPIDGLGEL